MKRAYLLLLIVITFGLSACVFEPKVGGPCAYKIMTTPTKVTALHTSYSVLSTETQTYQAPLNLFAQAPKLGERYTLTFEHITRGTCTPISIKSVELLDINSNSRQRQ